MFCTFHISQKIWSPSLMKPHTSLISSGAFHIPNRKLLTFRHHLTTKLFLNFLTKLLWRGQVWLLTSRFNFDEFPLLLVVKGEVTWDNRSIDNAWLAVELTTHGVFVPPLFETFGSTETFTIKGWTSMPGMYFFVILQQSKLIVYRSKWHSIQLLKSYNFF